MSKQRIERQAAPDERPIVDDPNVTPEEQAKFDDWFNGLPTVTDDDLAEGNTLTLMMSKKPPVQEELDPKRLERFIWKPGDLVKIDPETGKELPEDEQPLSAGTRKSRRASHRRR